MHILFFSHYYPPEVNAPASRTSEHAKEWVRAGHKVTVITCAPNAPDGVIYEGYKNVLYESKFESGVKIIRVWAYIAPNKGFARRIANYLSYMVSAVLVSLFVTKVDIIVATSPQFFCGWAGVISSFIKRKKFVLEIRDIWPESILTVGAMEKSPVITLLEKMEIWMYRFADRIITVGNGYREKIISRGIDSGKVDVVINGVDLKKFNHVSSDRFRKNLGCTGKWVCAYVGTLGMAHGLDVMLRAANDLKKSGDDSKVFWLVGSGAERHNLEQKAKAAGLDNIYFTGKLPKEDMVPLLSEVDACLVHLSGTELFATVIPSKIFEFMAMNKPIIMGVKGEAQEIVVGGKAGVPMEPDSEESLIECLQLLRQEPQKFNGGRNLVEKKFQRQVLAHKMLKIINKVAIR